MTPYWPSANGEVERFNITLGKILQTAQYQRKGLEKGVTHFLLQYQTTLHCIMDVPPATFLFKCNNKNGIPSSSKPTNSTRDTAINKRDNEKKANIKKCTDS